jgi:endonuclease YncB( thermonuclease family)
VKIDRLLVMVLLWGLISAHAASATGCEPELQGEGHVSAVIDARTFRLDDGREVRLSGIETIATRKSDGVSVLTSLVADRHVILRGESDAPDRYGRQHAYAFLGQSGPSVQSLLLDRGEALFSAGIVDKTCATELTTAEAAARHAKRGTWINQTVIKNAESSGDILAGIGQFAIIEGKVLSVREAGATFYINFGRRWTRDFAVTISRRAVPSFEDTGIKLKSLENRRIRVRGWIEQRGGPRIEAVRAGQIELIGD